MNESKKLTVEALHYYVPLFQLGDYALNQLYSSDLTPAEKNRFETMAELRELATRKIVELSKPLLINKVNSLLATSHLRYGEEDLFNLLFYAGVNGIIKGLKKFNTDKIDKSATNYILQWFDVYAKRELLVHEAAPFNIPPSRFAIYKKISAVRKKLYDILERAATNEEIYEYFQSGKAEVKSMNGPLVKSKNKVSKANKNITMDLIEEQETYEKNLHNIYLIDPTEDFGTLVITDDRAFKETIFGVFLDCYNFTQEAALVLKSMLNIADSAEESKVKEISKLNYVKMEKNWKNLLADINGPFYEFLVKINSEGFTDFDIEKVIRQIESTEKKVHKSEYLILFEGEKIESY